MESGRDTRADRIIRNLKNRPVIAVAVVLVTILVALAAFTNALRTLSSVVPRSETRLEVVDVSLIDKRDDVMRFKKLWLKETSSGSYPFTGEMGKFPASAKFPLLDIKLRNTGKEVAVLHALEIGVSRMAMRDYPLILCAPLPPTWEYNLLLDELLNFDKGPGKVDLELSQVVEPNKADRFIVTVGQTKYIEAAYELTIAFRFNKNERLNLGQFLLKIAGPPVCETAWRLNAVRRPSDSQ